VAKLLRLVPKKQTSNPNHHLTTSFDPEKRKGAKERDCVPPDSATKMGILHKG
jgi:hypothetical protein